MTNPPPAALEVRDITKQFPGVLANDHISFTLGKGEVLALLGENGAGKSTLMNIIYGLYTPDEGQILVNGEVVNIHDPNDAIRLGIGMVHQHFMLVPPLTVTENIILGNETMRGMVLDRNRAAEKIRALSKQYRLNVDPDAYVRDISVGDQQRVEIIKALYRGAEILILDEPTAVLTPQEADDLFEVIRSLVAQGKSIIFISHKLREVISLADRITVLRHGKVVGSALPQDATRETLAAMMVGRDVSLVVEKTASQPKNTILTISNLTVKDDRGLIAVKGLNLEVRAGEIVGVAGVQGNGQTELVEAIVGLRTPESGTITIDGHNTTTASPRSIFELGVAHIPEDRQADGLVSTFPIADNMVLNRYYIAPYSHGIVRDEKAITEEASQLAKQYDVRTPSVMTAAGSLSGGNQQKVIVAREFSRPVTLVVAAQPTRGVDVGSIEFIHKQIVELRDKGAAVLVVSAELDEVLALADRVAVIYHGTINAIVERADATRNQLGLLMAGIEHETPAS